MRPFLLPSTFSTAFGPSAADLINCSLVDVRIFDMSIGRIDACEASELFGLRLAAAFECSSTARICCFGAHRIVLPLLFFLNKHLYEKRHISRLKTTTFSL